MLNNMPKSLDEIIFSQVSISFLWKETEGINDLKIILKNLEEFKTLNLTCKKHLINDIHKKGII